VVISETALHSMSMNRGVISNQRYEHDRKRISNVGAAYLHVIDVLSLSAGQLASLRIFPRTKYMCK
jgi:hypothetical protein